MNAVYTENKQKRSDVLTVARFLHHLLENKRGWAVISRMQDVSEAVRIASDRRSYNARCLVHYRGGWQRAPRDISHRGTQKIRYLDTMNLAELDAVDW